MVSLNTLATLVVVVAILTLKAQARVKISEENFKYMNNMVQWMDRNSDPCMDFYQYACGGRGGQDVDNLREAQVEFVIKTQEALAQNYPITGSENQDFTDKIQIYYNVLQTTGNAPLMPYLDEIKPATGQEWSFLEEMRGYGQSENYQNWTRLDLFGLLGKLFSYGLNDVVFTLEVDEINNEKMIELTVPETTDFDKRELMQVFANLGFSFELANKYLEEFEESHEYWNNLYQQSVDEEYIATTYLELYDSIFLSLYVFVAQSLPQPIKLEEYTVSYPKNYYPYIETRDWTPEQMRQFSNYFIFKFLMHLQSSGDSMDQLSSVMEKFSLGLNYIHYKHLYLPQKEQLEQGLNYTFTSIYEQFKETVAENHLAFKPQQLKEVTEKIGKLQINVGNLPDDISDEMVAEYYSAMDDMDPSNFHKNELSVRRFVHLEKVICPDDMYCGKTSPFGFYHPKSNKIFVPFTALSPPLYDWSWHPVFAMSVLGYAFGHELTHAIDPSNLDDRKQTPSFRGNSLRIDTISSIQSCLTRAHPTEVVNERLADIVGSQLAFDTYKRVYNMQPDFTQVPWQQLYFLSLAQTFCTKLSGRDEAHGGPKIRLEEIVMNSKDFAQAFQCRADSPLNPEIKCTYI